MTSLPAATSKARAYPIVCSRWICLTRTWKTASRSCAVSCSKPPQQAGAARVGRQGPGGLERVDDCGTGQGGRDLCQSGNGLALPKRAFAFIVDTMSRDNRLFHAYRAGQAKAPATASDYANMITAALRLHGVTGKSGLSRTGKDLDQRPRPPLLVDRARRLSLHRRRHRRCHLFAPWALMTMLRRMPNGVMVTNLVALWLLTGDDRLSPARRRIVDGVLCGPRSQSGCPHGHAGGHSRHAGATACRGDRAGWPSDRRRHAICLEIRLNARRDTASGR